MKFRCKTLKNPCVFLTVTVLLSLILTSCSGGISGDEAKATISGFFEAIAVENYEKAMTFVHPKVSITAGGLEEMFAEAENTWSVDFKEGITIEKYTGFSTSLYDSNVGGAKYELSMNIKVGEKTIETVVAVVRNDDGYGIATIDIDE